MGNITYDPEKFQLNIARLKRGGHVFEVVVDPDLALAYRRSEKVRIEDVIKYEKIFMDAQKGLLSSVKLLEEMFETEEPFVVADIILHEGEVHLTAEYRKQQRDKKIKQIVNTIHKYGVDPRTQAPHPHERIERAIEEAKVHIEDNKSVDDQVRGIVKKLQPILPIVFETKVIKVILDATHAQRAYGIVKQLATIQKEQWLNTGEWEGVISIPAGLEQEFYEKLNGITHGAARTEVVEVKKK